MVDQWGSKIRGKQDNTRKRTREYELIENRSFDLGRPGAIVQLVNQIDEDFGQEKYCSIPFSGYRILPDLFDDFEVNVRQLHCFDLAWRTFVSGPCHTPRSFRTLVSFPVPDGKSCQKIHPHCAHCREGTEQRGRVPSNTTRWVS